MRVSANMILALVLIGLGLTASHSSASSKPMQGAAPPDGTNGQASTALPRPTPNPDASGRYHVGGGVTAPQIISSVEPEFTDKARRKKLGGTCVLSMLVDVTGKPQDVRVVTSIASSVSPKLRSVAMGLDENAVKAAKQYRFKPGTYQGKPVPVELKVEVDYRLY